MNAEMVWYLQTVHDLCEEYSQARGICGVLRRVMYPNAENVIRQGAWLCCHPETAAYFLAAVLGSDVHDSPIETLQSHGYYVRGNPRFFEEMQTKYDREVLTHFITCLMWAYLDHARPAQALRDVLGRTKFGSACDAESRLCLWINTVVQRYRNLPALVSIRRDFFGQPHFRVVLYHFVRDANLLDLSDYPAENARVAYLKAKELMLTPPFSLDDYEQQPLLLMCYLYSCIPGLVELPLPEKPPTVTWNKIRATLSDLEETKKGLALVNERVANLNESIEQISEALRKSKKARRPLPPPRSSPISSAPQSNAAQRRQVQWEMPKDRS
jgi:hypothetical protein